MKVYVVNGFTEDKKGGNPAGVAVCSSFPAEEVMQEVARKAGYSETVFVCPGVGGYKTRFFTPCSEVDLCGHATIAAFYLLAKLGFIEGEEGEVAVTQVTRVGKLHVFILFSDGRPEKVMMEQAPPVYMGSVEGELLERLCRLLGIEKEQVGLKNGLDYLPEIISTGLPDIIFPVINRHALSSITPDYSALARLSKELGVISVHAFTLETLLPSSTVHCRNFAPVVGINEESATGTSNGALGYYLYRKGILNGKEMTCEQGYCMGAPSLIYVKLENGTVKVGGKAVIAGDIEIEV